MNTVLIDKLEPAQMDELLGRHFPISRASLAPNLLDYLSFFPTDKKIAIERKHVTDLAGRVDDLEQQLKRALQNVDYVVLIVEGVWKPIDNGKDTLLYREKRDGSIFYSTKTANRPYSYYAGFLYRLAGAGIPVFWTSTLEGTAETIAEVVKLGNKKEPSGLFQHIVRTRQNIQSEDGQVRALVQLGMGEKTATLLLGKYKTVWELIHAPEDELLKISGIGKGIVEKLKRSVGKP